jgi:hypothetical protein
MIKKNTLLIGSGTILGALLVLNYLISTEIISCGNDPHLTCYFLLQHLNAFGFGLIPLFILSGVVYFIKESVFNAWLRLVYVYLCSLLIIVSTASSNNGGYIFSSDLSTLLIFIIPTFIIISLIIIVWKSFSIRNQGSLGGETSK